MSVTPTRLDIMRSDLSANTKLLALRILDLQGLREGVCKRPVSGLSDDCSLSPRTTKRALRELAEKGWLVVETTDKARTVRRLTVPTSGSVATVTSPNEGVSELSPEGCQDCHPEGVRTVTTGVSELSPPSELRLEVRSEVRSECTRDLASVRRDLVAAYSARYLAETRDQWMGDTHDSHIRRAAAWCFDTDPEDVDARIERLVNGIFADDWMRRHRWPWRNVKDPAAFAAKRGGYTRPAPAEAFEGGDTRDTVESFLNEELA